MLSSPSWWKLVRFSPPSLMASLSLNTLFEPTRVKNANWSIYFFKWRIMVLSTLKVKVEFKLTLSNPWLTRVWVVAFTSAFMDIRALRMPLVRLSWNGNKTAWKYRTKCFPSNDFCSYSKIRWYCNEVRECVSGIITVTRSVFMRGCKVFFNCKVRLHSNNNTPVQCIWRSSLAILACINVFQNSLAGVSNLIPVG